MRFVILKFRRLVTMLDIAREAEKATVEKTSRKRRCKRQTNVQIEELEDEAFESAPSASESDCITVVRRRLN